MVIKILLFFLNTLLVTFVLKLLRDCLYFSSYINSFMRTGNQIRWEKRYIGMKYLYMLSRWIHVHSEKMDKSYMSKEDKAVFHLVWTFLVPTMTIIGYFRKIYSGQTCLLMLLSILGWRFFSLAQHKKNRMMIFNKNAYRLYMFLHNQLSAGIHPKDSVMCLHRIVSEKALKERFQAFGSIYAQTLDFNLAFNEITSYCDGSDVAAFKIAIEQGLVVGENLTSLKKQEALMFSKYMNYLQLETERQKLKTFIVVTIFCAIIIVMIGLPLAIELDQAMDIIFLQ